MKLYIRFDKLKYTGEYVDHEEYLLPKMSGYVNYVEEGGKGKESVLYVDQVIDHIIMESIIQLDKVVERHYVKGGGKSMLSFIVMDDFMRNTQGGFDFIEYIMVELGPNNTLSAVGALDLDGEEKKEKIEKFQEIVKGKAKLDSDLNWRKI